MKAAQKRQLELLNGATARHDAFLAKVLTPDDKGTMPFAAAARMAGLVTASTTVMRVYMVKSGGSLVNSKNIATTFGVDPLKLSGAVILAYLTTNPTTGVVKEADLLSCDTQLVSVRAVQERAWRSKRSKHRVNADLCESVLPGDVTAARNAGGGSR